jgi:hypothetical protein
MSSAKLLAIAQQHLSAKIETLETRNSDSLDFYEVSAWGIKAALVAAYAAGWEAKTNEQPHGS